MKGKLTLTLEGEFNEQTLEDILKDPEAWAEMVFEQGVMTLDVPEVGTFNIDEMIEKELLSKNENSCEDEEGEE